jgi:hypothetical protein
MKKAWQQFLDFGKGWGVIIAVMGTAIAFGIKFETRIFSNPEIKYETEKMTKEGPTAEQKHRDRILDSINTAEAIKSRRMRDSIFKEVRKDQIEQKEAMKEQDCINLLNADQLFQIKEKLKTIQ